MPVYINNNFQPEIARGSRKKNIESLIERLNIEIVDSKSFDQRKYDKDVARGLQLMRLQFNIYFLGNIYRYSPRVILALIMGVIKRRLRLERI